MCIDVRCYYCILRSVHFVVDDRIIIENFKSIGVFDFFGLLPPFRRQQEKNEQQKSY